MSRRSCVAAAADHPLSELRLGKPREVGQAKDVAPELRSSGGGPSLSELRLGKPREVGQAKVQAERLAADRTIDRSDCHPLGPLLGIRRNSEWATGTRCAPSDAMPPPKRFVYVLKNTDPLPRFYVGLTSDVGARLAEHNNGVSSHTSDRGPWTLHVAIEFTDEQRALAFERYLKSGSGRAFAKRHFA